MKRINYLLIAGILLTSIACKKDKNDATGNVDIFLLESYEASAYGQIDESTIVLKTEALIHYAELKSYDDNKYCFEISESMKEELVNRDSAIDYQAFAVVADDEIIYSGYFWPIYSSSICNWVVIDPVTIDMSNELNVEIGYPGTPTDVEIPDNRNHQKILDIFDRDGKLK